MRTVQSWWAALIASLLAGCASNLIAWTEWSEHRGPAAVEPGSAITVLLLRWGNTEDADTTVAAGRYSVDKEQEFAKCIAVAMKEQHPTVRVIPPEEFRRRALPDIPPEHLSNLSQLPFGDPAFRERLRALDLRYLIALDGGTNVHLGSALGGGGPAAIGVIGQNRKSSVHASIIDVEVGSEARLSAYAEGDSSVLIVGLPVAVFVAYSETRICRELGAAISTYFQSDSAAAKQPAGAHD